MIDDRRKTDRQDKEAAAWFTLLSDTEVDSDDLERFDTWIQRAGNRAAYRRIEDISIAARDLRDDPELRAAARQALARVKPRPGLRSAPRRPALRLWAALGLAGALAAALVVAFIGKPTAYQTDVGGRMTTQLDDGSTLQLNTDTKVLVRFSPGERRIEIIKGQAFFDVAHDARRPFLVSAGPMVVRAIGTRFDVRHDSPAASVVLTQGRVQITTKSQPTAGWTLAPGQAIALDPGGRTNGPTAADTAALTGWTRNIITFHDIALSAAVAEINRYQHSKITLAAGVPAQAKVSGVFTAGDQDEFLDAAKANFDLDVRRKPDGGVELRPRFGG